MDLSGLKDKQVLVTGHTGFKGSWLTMWLNKLGARVSGLALDPQNDLDAYHAMNVKMICNDLRQDINNYEGIVEIFGRTRPEIVFHLAAQPLVIESYKNPLYTFNTNIIGTANILEASAKTGSVRAVVVITSDKCYENNDAERCFVESDRLGGNDPYSASKAAAEIVAGAFRRSFSGDPGFPAIATARAGNVIGGGDWAQNRIIPDCIRSLLNDKPVCLRNPHSVRPFQHVLEPLYGYLLLADRISAQSDKYGEAWNFGPGCDISRSVKEPSGEVIKIWGKGSIEVIEDIKPRHEAAFLALDITKSREKLGWNPVLTFEEAVRLTTEWYKAQSEGEDMSNFTLDQIEYYENLIR
jgi:CDP-glucose 4,6-dehydratase